MVDECFIGEIRHFAGDYAPEGWAFCDGAKLNISEYQALYTIIGTRYGGDGASTFHLPKLAPLKENDGGQTPIQYVICLKGIYPTRS